MAKKQKGLGKLGVDALLTGGNLPEMPGTAGEKLLEIGVERIRRGKYQPRLSMDEEKLEELAASIRSQGLIQPLVVRFAGGGDYELISGERRWRAAQRAGLETVPAIVREADDQTVAALSLIENIQRADLSALEEANALQQLVERFNLTHQEIADRIGRSRSSVSNLLRLLELAPDARKLLEQGRLEMGHARVLLRLPRQQQGAAGQEMVSKGMTVRKAERHVESLLADSGADKSNSQHPPSPEVVSLERRLAERLGTPVAISHGKRGGRIVIHYANLDVLEGILQKINGTGRNRGRT